MKLKSFLTAVCLFACSTLAAMAGDIKVEAQLIWATSADTSPNPKHKPVDADVQQKLASLPLKWSHFFEENRQAATVTDGAATKIELSPKSAVEVKHVQGDQLQITLWGNGKETLNRVQKLPKGEILVLGGNAPGDSAWLVIVKRVE